jgi:hypothetical protein
VHLRARSSLVADRPGKESLNRLRRRVHDVVPALACYEIAKSRIIDARGEAPRSGVGATLSLASGSGDDVDRASGALQTEGRQRAADEAFVE